MPTKLIEVALPLDVINRGCVAEKSRKVGKPTQLHHYWARRPILACRAVLFAQLVDDPSAHPELFPTHADQDAERKRLFEIIEKLSTWEANTDEKLLDIARAEIRRSCAGTLPIIADPFCGGGSIPLEAQRLGLKTLASDLNPVAVLLTKALVEIPALFTDRPPVRPSSGSTLAGTESWRGAGGLAEDVRYYGKWIRDEADRRIGHFYPRVQLPTGESASVMAWIWARTITCPNPACQAVMPLVRSFCLAKRSGRQTWVQPIIDRAGKRVSFVVADRPAQPSISGTTTRSGATCLVCDSPVALSVIREAGRAGAIGTQLMAIVAEGNRRRVYLSPTEDQERAAAVPIPAGAPDTELPLQALGFRVQAYGMLRHADLFTPRQLTALCTFCDLVQEARAEIAAASGGDQKYADAVATYLAFAASRLSDWSNSLCRWENNAEVSQQLFGKQSVSMVWDFAEARTTGMTNTGSFLASITNLTRALDQAVASEPGAVWQDEADRALQRDPGARVVVATDPPYYDNIGYADLSDFFYIWLRRALQAVYPQLLGTLLTPKSAELIADPARFAGSKSQADVHFEAGLRSVFRAAAEHQAEGIPITVFYAFKQSETDEGEAGQVQVASTGWEKLLESLVSTDLMVTGTWPMRTEMASRMRGQLSNALASSIILVCRQRPETAGVTDRRGFIQALRDRLATSLRDLQSGGIAPVDLAQAAIGPGMAVFSSYAKVVETDGSAMSVRTALALINQVLDEVTAEQEGEFDEDTRWAIAWYAENGMDDGAFGRADDLSRAKNVSVEGLVRAGIVKSGAGKVRLLERTELDPDWDPATDSRLTVWEITQQLIRRLLDESEASAADLLARVGGLGEASRDLAYRLFQIAESKKWSKEAGPYNALAAAWPELTRRAALGPSGQGRLV